MLTEKNAQQGELKREITVFGGISVVAGIMIGSGIFYLGSYVLQRANYHVGVALLAWLIGGVVSLLGALCFSELGASRPKAGGLTTYLNEVYHPVVGFMYGFSQWLIASPGSIAAVAIAIPTALLDFIPGMGGGQVKVVAIVLIVLFTAYNILGVKESSIMSQITLVGKVLPMALILVVALFAGHVMPDLDPTPVTSTGEPAGFTGGIGIVAFAVLSSLWAYEGWSNVTNLGGEIKEPGKTIPKMLIFGVGFVTIFYILFNFALYRVIPMDEAKAMIEADNVYLGTEVARRVLGSAGSIVVLIGMLVAMLGSLNGQVLAYARVGYAMSEEGHFFPSQMKLNKKGVPVIALITQAVIAIILVLARSLDQLTTLVVFLGAIGSLLGVFGVIVNRVRFPELEKPFKVPGGVVTVLISTLCFAALLISNFIDDPMMSILGVVVVPAIGAVIYIYYDRKIKANKANK